jgi:hypothetical protein
VLTWRTNLPRLRACVAGSVNGGTATTPDHVSESCQGSAFEQRVLPRSSGTLVGTGDETPRGARVLEIARQHVVAIPSGQSKGMALTPLSIGLFIAFCILIVVVYFIRKR